MWALSGKTFWSGNPGKERFGFSSLLLFSTLMLKSCPVMVTTGQLIHSFTSIFPPWAPSDAPSTAPTSHASDAPSLPPDAPPPIHLGVICAPRSLQCSLHHSSCLESFFVG